MRKGYITVFFALIFMVLMSFILSIFEGIRINAYRLKAECAYSVAANSVLGEYQVELLKMYDLFYVDTAYETGVPDYHHIEAHLWEYMQKNAEFSPASVEVNQIALSTDNKGILYRKQISDFMKNKIGVSYINRLSELFQNVSKEGFLGEDLSVKNTWENKWQKTMAQRRAIPDETWNKIEKYSPIEKAYEVRESFVLSQVIKDESDISKNQVNISDYVSNRELITGTGTDQELNLMDRIYFIGYLFEKFSHYQEKKGESPLCYEIEYLIGESGSDYENLSVVAKKILAVRESLNLSFLLADRDKMTLIKEISTALAAIVISPELEPAFEILIIGIWSYAESINDVKVLFEGGKVPFIKTKNNWYTDLSGGLGLNIEMKSTIAKQEGMDYAQYLELLLLFASDKKITYKSMDLIEMNIRLLKGNENFRMDGCAEDFLVNMVFEIPQFGSYQIVRKFGY